MVNRSLQIVFRLNRLDLLILPISLWEYEFKGMYKSKTPGAPEKSIQLFYYCFIFFYKNIIHYRFKFRIPQSFPSVSHKIAENVNSKADYCLIQRIFFLYLRNIVFSTKQKKLFFLILRLKTNNYHND